MNNYKRKRYLRFSPTWREVAQTRGALCLAVAIFASINGNYWILAWAIVYILLLILGGLFDESTIQLKRVRFIPALVDILFVSVIIYSVGTGSSWFLLYLFPINSVSRYLGYQGSLAVAILATGAYSGLYFYAAPEPDLNPFAFALRCASFFGIAAVAGNLSKTRRLEESKLIKTFIEIDDKMLSDAKVEEVFDLILEKGMELTASEMGHIRLIDTRTGAIEVISAVGEPERYDWGMRPLDESFSQKVIASKESLIIQEIARSHLIQYLGTYFRLHKPRPRSALFVPIIVGGEVIGVIAVYSRWRFHYTNRERRKLESLNSLIAMARKNAELVRDQQDQLHRLREVRSLLREELEQKAGLLREQQERLQLLHKIGEQLKAELNPSRLFDEVVELIYNQLNPEEAALFVVDDENAERIMKVAVKGPDEETTKQLKSIERSYRIGESLVGKIYETKKYEFLSSVDPDVKHVDDYKDVLPSNEIRHYIGVPLLKGDERLGVIRVINKRGMGYGIEQHGYVLSDKGFGADDLPLMQTIASQVAAAIQNAKVLAKYDEAMRYYKSLVDNSPDPIIVLDEDGNIKDFNNACEKIWGWTLKEIEGHPVQNYYESPERAKEIGSSLWKSRESNYRIKNYSTKIKHREGHLIPISLSASLLLNDEGKFLGSIGVFKDLRELQLLKERIIETEKLADFDKVVQLVGHDIKHEIGIILSNVKILLPQCDKDEQPETFELYTEIRDSSLYSLDSIQYLLLASKPKPPHKKVSCVEDIFREIKERMRRQAVPRGVEFSISYPQGEYDIFVDVEQMKQVFWNLYNNSLDSILEKRGLDPSFRGGLINVSTHLNDNQLVLLWNDDGAGINSEVLPHIFDAFITSKDAGSGLGLYIARSIIELHGGKISVDSEHGRRTCFKITLPLWDGNKTPKQHAHE